MSWRIINADCVEAMGALEPVDAIVCDPPYGLEFMGKEWDRLWTTRDKASADLTGKSSSPFVAAAVNRYSAGPRAQAWHEAWARAALRVLKPGGHLLAFGGTRTFHRLACGIEDAGFEVRDTIAWIYGSGFPKSLDVSKAIDKAAGIWRGRAGAVHSPNGAMSGANYERSGKGTPATDAAKQWQGWGTALKPAFEPIVVARKPLVGSVAANVEEYGTGALNIDGCRIEFVDDGDADAAAAAAMRGAADQNKNRTAYGKFNNGAATIGPYLDGLRDRGRWPANVILDEEAASILDDEAFGVETPSRFFYCPKPDRAERNIGLEGFDRENVNDGRQTSIDNPFQRGDTLRRNTHPTVKPVALMQYLCRLVTPPKGIILDPFLGSGTTGMAALREGFSLIGIEREAEYAEIARARIIGDAPLFNADLEVSA